MKILIINPHLLNIRGGAEINDLHLGKALRELGHEVDYCAIKGKPEFSENISGFFFTVNIGYYYGISLKCKSFIGKFIRHFLDIQFMQKLKKQWYVRLNSYDFILVTGRPVLTKIAKKVDPELCYAVRGKMNPIYYSYLYKSDRIIFWGGCEGDNPKIDFDRIFHLCLDPAIDHQIFNSNYQSDESPKGSKVNLIYVGRLDPIKQVNCIINAVAELTEEGFDLSLEIIGDGAMRDSLQSLVKQSKMTERIIFSGRQKPEIIASQLREADIFILASKSENHPIALKEAIATT